MQLQVWRTVIDRDASATAEAGRQATATTAGDWSRQPGVRPAGARQAARACHYVRREALRAAMDGDRRPRTTGRALSGQRVPAVCSTHTDRQPTATGVLLSVDQLRATVYPWHCVQVTSRRRLSEDI